MGDLQLDAKKTALVVIDLQKGVIGRPIAPHTAPEILERANRLAKAMRENGGTVVYVRVDFNDFLRLPVDQPPAIPDGPAADGAFRNCASGGDAPRQCAGHQAAPRPSLRHTHRRYNREEKGWDQRSGMPHHPSTCGKSSNAPFLPTLLSQRTSHHLRQS
jgi:nicotinamidase-related amidase